MAELAVTYENAHDKKLLVMIRIGNIRGAVVIQPSTKTQPSGQP